MEMVQNITRSEKMVVYNRMRAIYRDEPKALQRLNKALGILQSKGLTDKMIEYGPSGNYCYCPDWKYRNAKNKQQRQKH